MFKGISNRLAAVLLSSMLALPTLVFAAEKGDMMKSDKSGSMKEENGKMTKDDMKAEKGKTKKNDDKMKMDKTDKMENKKM